MIPHNPNQFKLFYGGQELQDSITHSADQASTYGDTNLQDMWARKLSEAKQPESSGGHGAGLYESMLNEGVRPHTKLEVSWGSQAGRPDEPRQQIYEGHHRVAVAADIERNTGRAMWINTVHEDRGLQTRLHQGLTPLLGGEQFWKQRYGQLAEQLPRLGMKLGTPRPVGQKAPAPGTYEPSSPMRSSWLKNILQGFGGT